MTKAKSSPARGRAASGRAWRKPFLAELARTSNVAASARAAGIEASAAYKARRSDPAFAHHWFEALCEGYDNLELDMLCRLREGELAGATTPAGKARRKYDNATAFRLLAAHRASVQRERGRNDYAYEDELLASINAKLEKMRQRVLAASGSGSGADAAERGERESAPPAATGMTNGDR
ncbi:hypothetical protein [Pelagerythrobacter marensis]|uniref:Terminase n=1 Tax=Pelagerythrobacter marensis TaxID=543877 RepID=A0A0G3XAA1_9SPHN|nr:hypothetical protein [Pelagerythrobacter marensis]AKM08112.1 hypothetical protein AM2010_2050 [Pelagerythrobacter marensis]